MQVISVHPSCLFRWRGKERAGRVAFREERRHIYTPASGCASPRPCNAINHPDKFNYPAVCDKARRASSLLSNFTYLASPLSLRLLPSARFRLVLCGKSTGNERRSCERNPRDVFRKLKVRFCSFFLPCGMESAAGQSVLRFLGLCW